MIMFKDRGSLVTALIYIGHHVEILEVGNTVPWLVQLALARWPLNTNWSPRLDWKAVRGGHRLVTALIYIGHRVEILEVGNTVPWLVQLALARWPLNTNWSPRLDWKAVRGGHRLVTALMPNSTNHQPRWPVSPCPFMVLFTWGWNVFEKKQLRTL